MSKASRVTLNQDIQQALDEIGKVEYTDVLRSQFPPRPIIPREYRRTHCVARRVQCLYIGPGDEIPQACPNGWDLLALFGVAFTRRDSEAVVKSLESAATGERVLVGVPLRTLPGTAQFKELAALEHLGRTELYAEGGEGHEAWLERLETLRSNVRERLRQSLRPKGFRWLHQGEVLEEAPAGTRGAFFTGVLAGLFPRCPRVRMTGSRREQQEAINELLDISNPLQLPTRSRRGGPRVLSRVLVEAGLLVPEEDRGSYVRYRVEGPLPEDSPLGPAWSSVLEHLCGEEATNRRQPLSDVLEWMERPPLGLRGPLRLLLLGAALRYQFPDLELHLDGEPIPVSGVSLRRAVADPRSWELVYHPARENELAFLRQVWEGFEPGSPGEAGPWTRARRALLDWHAALPALTRSAEALPSEPATSLLALLRDRQRTSNARDLLGAHLPELFGEPEIPIEEDQGPVLERLAEARTAAEAFVDLRRGQLAEDLARLFGRGDGDGDALPWLDERAREWLGGLHPGTESRAFSEWAGGLRDVILGSGDAHERWFATLPEKLGLPPLADWNPDLGHTFLSRVSRARLELELWRIRELFPLPEEPEMRREQIRGWIREVMGELLELSPEQQESALLDLLEDAVWAREAG